MKKNSKLTTLSLLSVLVLLSSLVAPINLASVFAEDVCANTNAEKVEITDSESGVKTTTLCKNVASLSFKKGSNILDLNGFNVTRNIEVKNGASLVIIDGGNNGTVVGDITAKNDATITIEDGTFLGELGGNGVFIINGGIFATCPDSNDLADGKKGYVNEDGLCVIEDEITIDSFTVSSDSITIRKGQSVDFSASISNSTATISIKSNNEEIAVFADGKVTGVEVGNTTINISTNYEPNVIKTVDVEVLPTLESVEADDVIVRIGNTSAITPTFEDSSVSPVTFSYTVKDDEIAAVDEEGIVTGVNVGTTTINIVATIEEISVETTINVSVYDIQAGETDTEGIAADTVRDLVDEGMSEDKQQEVFGTDYVSVGGALQNAMADGATITTNVNVKEITDTSEYENEIAKIDAALADKNVTGITYYDVTVTMDQNGDVFGKLKQLKEPITVAIADVTDPETGYTREYYVVAYHDGDTAEILSLGEGFKIENGKIYLISDRFSTFAVAYEDTLQPEEDEPNEEKPIENEPNEEKPIEGEPNEEKPIEDEPTEGEPTEEGKGGVEYVVEYTTGKVEVETPETGMRRSDSNGAVTVTNAMAMISGLFGLLGIIGTAVFRKR